MRKCTIIKPMILFCVGMILTAQAIAYEKEVDRISQYMATQIVDAGKKNIAVVDFSDLQGNVTELGRFLSEEFSLALASAGKGFEVIDRGNLKLIIEEHKLSSTGIIDLSTAKKLGKITGVDALITGTITPFGDSIRLSVKILDTSTAKVIGGLGGKIARTKAMDELLAKGVASIERTSAINNHPYSGKSIEQGGFIFSPLGCKVSDGKAICVITFMNNGKKERKLQIMGGFPSCKPNSHLYNSAHYQLDTNVKIGKKTNSCKLEENFIPNVPVNVEFIGKDAASDASSFTVVIGMKGVSKSVVFHNIPVNK